MNRSVVTLLLILMLSGCSVLRHRTSAATAATVVEDTLTLTEAGFNRRVAETRSALTHYISSSVSARDSAARRYYMEKALRLFHPESRIYLSSDGSPAGIVSADSLRRLINRGAISALSVDSLTVPQWDRVLLSRRDSVAKAPAAIWPAAESRPAHAVVGRIPLPIEFTEDGAERAIVFGDAYMTCLTNAADTVTAGSSGKISYSSTAGPQSPHQLPWYDCRIKLVDEFFDRFNGKEFRSDIVTDSTNVRLANMMLLFDADMFASADDPIFAAAKEMAQQIIDRDIRISYSDSTWSAIARCEARFGGKPAKITLRLNVEQRKPGMYKWVITGAEGDCLTLPSEGKTEKLMILPDAHETDFMALHDITTGRDDYIVAYAARGTNPDPTSVFFALVYAGTLEIDYVEDLSFVFYQIPGYRFSIRNFERDSYNCGWLIDSFEKLAD